MRPPPFPWVSNALDVSLSEAIVVAYARGKGVSVRGSGLAGEKRPMISNVTDFEIASRFAPDQRICFVKALSQGRGARADRLRPVRRFAERAV